MDRGPVAAGCQLYSLHRDVLESRPGLGKGWSVEELAHVSVNKVLLEQSPIPSCTYCPWLLSHYYRRVELLQQIPSGKRSLKYLLPEAFQKKGASSTALSQDLPRKQ